VSVCACKKEKKEREWGKEMSVAKKIKVENAFDGKTWSQSRSCLCYAVREWAKVNFVFCFVFKLHSRKTLIWL
jgi:hypothetical protein